MGYKIRIEETVTVSQPMGFVVRSMGKPVAGLYSGHQNDAHGLEASQSTGLPGALSASGSAAFPTFLPALLTK